MADWSWEGLKGSFGNIMQDPGALTANPLFTGGMGLLGASYDSRVNPFQAALQGMQQGYAQQQSDEDRERQEEMRKKLAPIIEAMMRQQAGMAPQAGAPTPTEQSLQMSLLPGMPGSSANVPGEPVMGGGGMASPLPGLGAESNRLLQQLGLRNMQR